MEGDGHIIQFERMFNSSSAPHFVVTYLPDPPGLTIRDVMGRLSSSACPSHFSGFKISIFHPPTLETVFRQNQIKERATLLRRTSINALIAIPTLLIGIVFTSLVPSRHRIRLYWEEPIILRTSSRAVWALFFLSTPVQFYCARGFHIKAFKEIVSLWRSERKATVRTKFLRFGSMNLLMSLGISVSYFSSISLLAMSAADATTSNNMGKNTMGTTYFDSVVFLSMFLLIGKRTTRC